MNGKRVTALKKEALAAFKELDRHSIDVFGGDFLLFFRWYRRRWQRRHLYSKQVGPR